MTAIVSAIVIASSWSCVTWMNVIPTSCWIALQLELHLLAQLEVERAERLVEQEHARLVDERARERDALLLAAGELRRLALLEARELDELEHLARPGPRSRCLRTLRRRRPKATFSKIVRCGKSA